MTKRICSIALMLCVLFCSHSSAAPPQAETIYHAVIIMGQKVGYTTETITHTPEKVITAGRMHLVLKRGDVELPMTFHKKVEETPAGKLLRFEVIEQAGLLKKSTVGVMGDNGKLEVTTIMAGQEKKVTIDYPEGALMSHGEDLARKKQGLKPGTSYQLLLFMTDSLTAHKVDVTIERKEQIDLFGRLVEATRAKEVMHVPQAEIVATIHYDDNYTGLRAEAPMVGMMFTMIACDKAFALSKAKSSVDFLDALMVTSPKPIPLAAKKVILTLKPKTDKKVTIPETAAQKVEGGDEGTITVTVERPPLGGAQARPYSGNNDAALAALKPTPYVQSDAKPIAEKAKEVVRSTSSAAEAANTLAAWVGRHINTKDLSVGQASALEVFKSKTGDCSEHAVLLAALCRAAGIPARLASGLMYAPSYHGRENVFVGHQWTQVYVSDKWVDIDATLPSPHYTASRITLSTDLGDDTGWWVLLNSLGSFEIVDVEVAD